MRKHGRFEKCRHCEHDMRLLDHKGRTMTHICYFQWDTCSHDWNEEDCDHFFEPRMK